MSNAVTSLTAAIVQSDLKQKSPANSPAPNKLSLILTASSLSSSSSNSEVNSTEEQLNLSMTSNNTTSNSKSVDGQNTTSSSPTSSVTTPNNKSNLNKCNYYHPNHQQQHYVNPHGIPMNLNFQAPAMNGLQYIQLNSNPNSINNSSPISSSPSTGSTSIQYIAHQQPHFSKHHNPNSYPSHLGGSAPTIIHGGPPFQPQHQQQQFQQLHQFHSQFQSNYKDTRWLTLEVCREFQRNKCNRNETECKFAHPPSHVEIINGKVIACYDSLKGKCTRKEPACKYLHPPQHLKDQLLQNGKNNLVLRQVALAMMQQQQQQPNVQTNPETTAALLAAATRPTSLSQYATFTTSPTNTNNSNPSNVNPQFIPSLANGGLAYQQVQLSSNGQPHLLQMLPPPSGYSHPNQHQLAHNLHMQQQSNIYANDPNSNILQVTQNSTISPPSSVNNANSILPPQQRTDRLQQPFELNENNGAVFTLENGQYQVPQYQVYTPMIQRPANNQASDDTNSQVDSTNNGNIYSVKRAALTDIKTGMPVFQPLGQNSLHQLSGSQTGVNIHQVYPAQSHQTQQIALTQQIAALNYPSAYNISQMQYAPYPATFSLPYNGQPTSIPRL